MAREDEDSSVDARMNRSVGRFLKTVILALLVLGASAGWAYSGFSGAESIALVRGLVGLEILAYDLVEVMPSYDPAGVTSLLAANLVYEFISLDAVRRREQAGDGL